MQQAIEEYEPRVEVLDVVLYDPGAAQPVPRGIENIFFFSTGKGLDERYTLIITVHCRIKNTALDFTVEVNMNRLR